MGVGKEIEVKIDEKFRLILLKFYLLYQGDVACLGCDTWICHKTSKIDNDYYIMFRYKDGGYYKVSDYSLALCIKDEYSRKVIKLDNGVYIDYCEYIQVKKDKNDRCKLLNKDLIDVSCKFKIRGTINRYVSLYGNALVYACGNAFGLEQFGILDISTSNVITSRNYDRIECHKINGYSSNECTYVLLTMDKFQCDQGKMHVVWTIFDTSNLVEIDSCETVVVCDRCIYVVHSSNEKMLWSIENGYSFISSKSEIVAYDKSDSEFKLRVVYLDGRVEYFNVIKIY